MALSLLSIYLPYSVITAYTPGPNNLLALYAVGQGGWRRGLRVLLGIACGFVCVMFLCAAFCYQLAVYIPSLSQVLRYVGAAYIIWLAVHIARSKPAQGGEGKEIGFWRGFILQFVNVKIIMYAITIYTGYILPATSSVPVLLASALLISVIGVSGCLTWAVAGGALQRVLTKYYRPFNLVMAAVVVVSAVQLVLG